MFSIPSPLLCLFFFPGSPPPVITWSKLRAPLPWKHTDNNGVLTLTDVGRQDSGQYICNATNKHGYSEAYTQMEVESESAGTVTNMNLAPDHIKNKRCHLHAGPPYATSLPDQVKLRPGDSLSLQCLALGSHPIKLEWSRVGRPGLPAGTETTWAGKLTIAQVKTSDSGTYKCVASNHIGTSEALAKVIIRGESIIVLLAVYKDHKMKPEPSDHWRAAVEIKKACIDGYFFSMLKKIILNSWQARSFSLRLWNLIFLCCFFAA